MDVIIVDDEPAARRTLCEYCAKDPELTVIGEYADGAAALAAIERRAPHLLFLDIQMDEMSGLQLARAVNRHNSPLVVFVTAYDQYALDAFEVNATDYLLKPFNERRFRAMLARVRHRWSAQIAADRQTMMASLITQLERAARGVAEARPRLLADTGGRLQMIDVAQVEAIEADRNYITLRVDTESYHARSTMQQAEEAMRSQPLLRISRSCLININHIREVHKTPRGDYILVLNGGTTVSSSEGYRDKVRSQLEPLILGGR